jgi:hypothetical protein
MQLREIMTAGVVTAFEGDPELDVAPEAGQSVGAQRMTPDVIEGALPDFYLHERG